MVALGFVCAWLIRPLLLPDWTLKARNRIDIFYSLIFLMLLTLAWVLRAAGLKP